LLVSCRIDPERLPAGTHEMRRLGSSDQICVVGVLQNRDRALALHRAEKDTLLQLFLLFPREDRAVGEGGGGLQPSERVVAMNVLEVELVRVEGLAFRVHHLTAALRVAERQPDPVLTESLEPLIGARYRAIDSICDESVFWCNLQAI